MVLFVQSIPAVTSLNVQATSGDGAGATAARIVQTTMTMMSGNGSKTSGFNVPNSSGVSESRVAASTCPAFNDDTCLLESPFWSSPPPWLTWSCSNTISFCAIWAKDMQRCCSLACGTVYLTEDACTHNGNLGSCVYPHHGSNDCGGTVLQSAAAGGTVMQAAAAGVSATGDPHLQNIHGEKFDLMEPGGHILIQVPRKRSEKTLLRVDAEAQRIGGQCADIYFQELNITGAWADAKLIGGFHYHAQDINEKPPHWAHFGSVKLKVAHGRTQEGVKYLNLYVKDLAHAGYAVGGLLGDDDHTEAATAPEGCVHRLSL